MKEYPVQPARPVLVRHRGGIWSGAMARWERNPTGWWGAVAWDVMGQPCRGLVPATHLRPYDSDRPVQVRNILGEWESGLLLGWRRRRGVRYWEIEVRIGEDAYRGVIDWFPANHVRRRDGSPYADAF